MKQAERELISVIRSFVKEHGYAPTVREIAELMGDITQDGVKYHLEKLKATGKLRRVGPDKGGHWEVVNL